MRELRNIEGVHPRDLTNRQRLLLGFVIGLVSVVLVLSITYNWGMRTLEDRPQSIFRSVQVVVQALTTTGFGGDAGWTSPGMNVLMTIIQVSGVVIGFVTLRVLIIPLYERTPLNLDDRLTSKSDHVVIAEYRRDTDLLLEELEELGIDYALIESDEEEAKRLSDDGYQAIKGDPEERDDLDRATIERASLLITDAGDNTASIVLTALEANEDLRVISFTESTRRERALAELGVDRSIPPHALIGRRLAEKATLPVTIDERSDADDIDVREILVRRDSPLHGARVDESPITAHPDLTLVAGWFDGELRLPLAADDELTPNTVLVVAGPESEIDDVANEIAGGRSRRIERSSTVIVAGFGEGGTAALEALPEDVSVTTIDDSADRTPDIVGDVTEPETLHDAGIEEASALIVTVDDDSTALLTIAIARSLSSEVEILVRVNDTEKVRPAFRAGADYVLAIQRVSARLVATEVHGERVMDPTSQIRLVRAEGAPFAGQRLEEARRNTERGWTVIGLSRGGTVHTDERTTIEADDDVFVAGSDAAIQEFERTVDTP
ncbi:potassium channel family protein [Saliphagus infecundisoli]|uniref:Potassium channel family protein n=1 Tax=Saliphagus infecundisoli TaxID=1849069 RepID=A0ABD5QB04_9EURY|nr:NAD-binding protein [Saliphagus infecundisoli]